MHRNYDGREMKRGEKMKARAIWIVGDQMFELCEGT